MTKVITWRCDICRKEVDGSRIAILTIEGHLPGKIDFCPYCRAVLLDEVRQRVKREAAELVK